MAMGFLLNLKEKLDLLVSIIFLSRMYEPIMLELLLIFSHVLQQVTYTDPRVDDLSESGDASRSDDDQLPNNPREYTIFRDEKLGYGFIAGSEKPVIVRSVTPGK